MSRRLQLTQNAQFFLPKTVITDEIVAEIFDAATQNAADDAPHIVEEIRQRMVATGNLEYVASVRVFKTKKDVYFFDESIADLIHAFIVLLEIDNHVVLLKKSCSNISETVDEYLSLQGNTALTSTFNDEDVEFQKISLRNMTTSNRAMRSRSFEASDLKGLLSTHAAGRSIPFFMKIRQGNSLKTISAQAGRLVESSTRRSLEEIALWAHRQIALINRPSTNKEFLSGFAKTVELKEVLATTAPSAILVESSLLQDRLLEIGSTLKYTTKKKRSFILLEKYVLKLMLELEKVYEVGGTLKIVGQEDSSWLRCNDRSITFSSKALRRIAVEENGTVVSLQKLILTNGFYSICFSDPKFMYFLGRCFEDSSGVAEIPSILKLLVPQTSLISVTSEKGNVDPPKTCFDITSVFGAVERIHASDDFIFCDDLGVEWADHITLNSADSCISFIHSKHGNDVSTSASKLHDVVGQAIKNLGHMQFSVPMLMRKYGSKFNIDYNLDTVSSQIPRTRKGDPSILEAFVKDLLSNYRVHRKCILACSFLSKSQVALEFQKIGTGVPIPGHIIQLLWILSSFAHAVKDAHAEPIIYCQP